MSVLVTGGAGYIGSHMVLGLLDRGEMVEERVALGHGLREGDHLQALGQARKVGERRDQVAVDEGQARGLDPGKAPGGLDRIAGGLGVGGLGRRRGLTDGSAQVGVLERLDAAMRQARRLEIAEGLLAGDGGAGKLEPLDLEELRQPGLGGGAEGRDVGHGHAASFDRYSA